MLAGGLASMSTQLCCYWTDYLKTHLQTTKFGESRSLLQLAADTYNEYGLRRMYTGLHVQLLRGFPSAAVGMFVFE